MDEKRVALEIVDLAKDIAKAICRGKDVEITKTANGLSVKEITKRRID